jgi:hypothetical protein
VVPSVAVAMRGHRLLVMAQGMVNRLVVRGLGVIAPVCSAPLEVCAWDGLLWLLVMSRRGYTFLLTSGSCTAMPRVVGVRHGPGMGTRALTRGLAYLQVSSEADPTCQGVGRGGALTREVGRGGTRGQGVGRDRACARGIGRARNLLDWAGSGRNYANNHFRRAEVAVF